MDANTYAQPTSRKSASSSRPAQAMTSKRPSSHAASRPRPPAKEFDPSSPISDNSNNSQSLPTPKKPDHASVRVAIIGAGPAGLATGTCLHRHGIQSKVFEARARVGGRVLTVSLDDAAETDFKTLAWKGAQLPDSKLDSRVDIGASVMHGCGDSSQFVLRRALRAKIRAPICAGGHVYESTTYAAWYDRARRVPPRLISDAHAVHNLAQHNVAISAQISDDPGAPLGPAWLNAVGRAFDRYTNVVDRTLNPEEDRNIRRVVDKIAQRDKGYCAPMAEINLSHVVAELPVTSDSARYFPGEAVEHDEVPDPKLLVDIDNKQNALDASEMDRQLAQNNKPAVPIASMRGGTGDRVVIDGYTPFLIDSLKKDLDIQTESIVKKVDTSRDAKVLITTSDGKVEEFDYAVVALPLAVLQGKFEKSKVEFNPPLSDKKLEAIHGMGMGVHNKVVLRFNPDDVFWPRNIPQLNCYDLRFQFFNLHAYGKTGVIVAHVFAESGFSRQYDRLTDEEIVEKVLKVLYEAFIDDGKWCTKVKRAKDKEQSKAPVFKKNRTKQSAPKREPKIFIPPERKSTRLQERAENEKKDGVLLKLRRRRPRPMPLKLRVKKESTREFIEETTLESSDGVKEPPQKKARVEGLGSKSRISTSRENSTSSGKMESVETSANGDNQTSGKTAVDGTKPSQTSEGGGGGGGLIDEEILDEGGNEDSIDDSQEAGRIKSEDAVSDWATTQGEDEVIGDIIEEEVLDSNLQPAHGKDIMASDSQDPLKEMNNEETVSESLGSASNDASYNDSILTSVGTGDIPQKRPNPRPVKSLVTRWQDDEFAGGSYSFMGVGGRWEMLEELRRPEFEDRVYFAGEHASNIGWQCVHGAYETGIMAAHGILVAAGLRDSNEPWETADEFPPEQRKSLVGMEDEDARNACSMFAWSHGHLYDVLDSMLFHALPGLVEEVPPQFPKLRNLLWKWIVNQARAGDECARIFLAVRMWKTKNDGKAVAETFVNRNKPPRGRKNHNQMPAVTRKIDNEPWDYPGELEEAVNHKDAKSLRSLANLFMQKTYKKDGIVFPMNLALEAAYEKCEDENEDMVPETEEEIALVKWVQSLKDTVYKNMDLHIPSATALKRKATKNRDGDAEYKQPEPEPEITPQDTAATSDASGFASNSSSRRQRRRNSGRSGNARGNTANAEERNETEEAQIGSEISPQDTTGSANVNGNAMNSSTRRQPRRKPARRSILQDSDVSAEQREEIKEPRNEPEITPQDTTASVCANPNNSSTGRSPRRNSKKPGKSRSNDVKVEEPDEIEGQNEREITLQDTISNRSASANNSSTQKQCERKSKKRGTPDSKTQESDENSGRSRTSSARKRAQTSNPAIARLKKV